MTPPSAERSYDLLMRGSASSLFHLDRGVTLADDHLAWSADGVADGGKLASITTVRLQTGGSWQHPLAMCAITFKDDFVITVNSGAPFGTETAAQEALYRDFVRDLHRRLMALGAPVRFRAGLLDSRYPGILIITVIAVLFSVGIPFVLLLIVRDLKVLGLLVFSAGFNWPLVRMVSANAPRDYDPHTIPDDLLP